MRSEYDFLIEYGMEELLEYFIECESDVNYLEEKPALTIKHTSE